MCFNYDVTFSAARIVWKTELIIQDNLYKKIGTFTPNAILRLTLK